MHPSHLRCPTHTLTLDPLPCKCNTPCQLRFRGSSIMYRRQFVQFKCVDGRKSAQVPTPWLESKRSIKALRSGLSRSERAATILIGGLQPSELFSPTFPLPDG